MIKKLASHLGEYRRAALLTPMFAALEAVMDILLPTIMAFIIDLGIEKGDMNAIVKYGLLTFAVAAIALLLGVLAGKYAAEASTGFAGNLRDAMYENIQHYSFSNIDKFSTAGLVTRMTTDVTNLQNAFQMMERMCVRAPIHLVFALIMAFSIGGPLALIFVVAIAFLLAVLASIMVPTFKIFDRVFKNYDKLNSSVQENVSAEGELVTKGDANDEVDIRPVPYQNVLGRVVFSVPYVGYFLIALGSTPGKLLLGWIVLMGVAFCVVGSVLSSLADRHQNES